MVTMVARPCVLVNLHPSQKLLHTKLALDLLRRVPIEHLEWGLFRMSNRARVDELSSFVIRLILSISPLRCHHYFARRQ